MHKTLLVFPGRFSPLGKHHVDAGKTAQNELRGMPLVFASSNKTTPGTAPLTFMEKKQWAESIGVTDFIHVKSPYRIDEYVEMFPEMDSLIFIVGEKDRERLSKSSRFIEVNGDTNDLPKIMEGECGYYIVPNSRTYFRSASSFRKSIRENGISIDVLRKYLPESIDMSVVTSLALKIQEGSSSTGVDPSMPDSAYVRPGKKLKIKWSSWMDGIVQLEFPKADDPYGNDPQAQQRYRQEIIINPENPSAQI